MLGSVLDVVFTVLALLVGTWVLIFGGIGALLSRSRGRGAASGLALGTLLGPIGWAVTWWTTRAPRLGPSATDRVRDRLETVAGAVTEVSGRSRHELEGEQTPRRSDGAVDDGGSW
jgi:hypothetical protein